MESFERPYKRVSRVKALLLFCFRPAKFIQYSVEHDIAWELSTSPDLRASYLSGAYVPNFEEHLTNARLRSLGLRRSLCKSALAVLVAALTGMLAGCALKSLVGTISSLPSNLLQAVAVGVILWATLWQLTRDLQSFGGGTLAERVHSWIFNSLYTLGTFILFVIYGWQAELWNS